MVWMVAGVLEGRSSKARDILRFRSLTGTTSGEMGFEADDSTVAWLDPTSGPSQLVTGLSGSQSWPGWMWGLVAVGSSDSAGCHKSWNSRVETDGDGEPEGVDGGESESSKRFSGGDGPGGGQTREFLSCWKLVVGSILAEGGSGRCLWTRDKVVQSWWGRWLLQTTAITNRSHWKSPESWSQGGKEDTQAPFLHWITKWSNVMIEFGRFGRRIRSR